MEKVADFAKIKSESFGITWIEVSSCWRLVLGARAGRKSDPYIQEYFSSHKYGSKINAFVATKDRKSVLMNRAEFKKYYHYQLNGRRVRQPRSNASIDVTGVIFSKGRRVRNRIEYFPAILASSGCKIIGRFPLRKCGVRNAFHSAVQSRFSVEGRRYIEGDVDEKFQKWIIKSDTIRFLKICEIRIPY
ncbi:MAG: hypothetical protein ACI93R_003802 [Flavobacteriales bacterium]|jgi:hypothetical protein